MRKIWAVWLAALCVLGLLAGCSQSKSFQDGVYSASFSDYDSRGYKDFLEVTVENSAVTSVRYDAVDANGALRSQDEKYRKDMEAVQGTYPEKYSADLVNQYMEEQDIDKVDTIAGATYSTQCFLALFKALEPSMQSGDTTPVVVDNIPEI